MVEQIENITQLTECIVCREQYDFQQRAPKILNCGHNICKLCFKKSYKQQQLKKKGIKCPICRKQDMRNKKSIQNDVQLMKIMQMQASQINNYEICQQHNEQYEIFCLECKLKMCIICGEEHRQTNHDVVDLEITYNHLLKISQELKQWHLGKISNVNMKYQELNEQTINLKIKFSEFESFVQDATDALIIMLQNHKKQKIKYAQEKYDEVMSSLQKQREEIVNKQLKLLENVPIPDLKTELSESHLQRLKEIEELIEYNKQVKDLQKFNFQSFQFLNINIIKTPFDVTPIANYSNFQELYDEFI